MSDEWQHFVKYSCHGFRVAGVTVALPTFNRPGQGSNPWRPTSCKRRAGDVVRQRRSEHRCLANKVPREIIVKLRNYILAGLLALAPVVVLQAQQKKEAVKADVKSYDAGVCGAESFIALHVVISGEDLKVVSANPGPGRVVELSEPDVWKFVKKDEKGLHYAQEDQGVKFELVLKADDKGVDGIMYADGDKVAYFYGPKTDGKSLAENGLVLYQMCLQLREQPSVPHSSADVS